MFDVITIALGVALGMLIAMFATVALMCNPKFIAWFTKVTMSAIVKSTKNSEEI